MAKPQIKPIAIEASVGNVFADLGLPDVTLPVFHVHQSRPPTGSAQS